MVAIGDLLKQIEGWKVIDWLVVLASLATIIYVYTTAVFLIVKKIYYKNKMENLQEKNKVLAADLEKVKDKNFELEEREESLKKQIDVLEIERKEREEELQKLTEEHQEQIRALTGEEVIARTIKQRQGCEVIVNSFIDEKFLIHCEPVFPRRPIKEKEERFTIHLPKP